MLALMRGSRISGVSAFLLSLIIVLPAWAGDPPQARVGRVALVAGEVSLRGPATAQPSGEGQRRAGGSRRSQLPGRGRDVAAHRTAARAVLRFGPDLLAVADGPRPISSGSTMRGR